MDQSLWSIIVRSAEWYHSAGRNQGLVFEQALEQVEQWHARNCVPVIQDVTVSDNVVKSLPPGSPVFWATLQESTDPRARADMLGGPALVSAHKQHAQTSH